MIKTNRAGFTVIEVMLFLAVGAGLTVAIIIGMGSSISNQRYKDSVATLQSDIQQQFEDAISVANYRDDDAEALAGCDVAARGASNNCVVLGKLMIISPESNRNEIQEYSIYGVEPPDGTDTATMNEYALLQAYQPAIASSTLMTSRLEWGASIRDVSGSDISIRVLVIRSPRSGLAYTFTQHSDRTDNLLDLISSSNASQQVLCVAQDGWSAPERMAVVIRANASSANGVEIRTNGMLAEEDMQC